MHPATNRARRRSSPCRTIKVIRRSRTMNRTIFIALWSGLVLAACDSANTDNNGNNLATSGSALCVQACQTFISTGCDTRAAEFCRSPQDSCDARYRAHATCVVELEALDRCAAGEPAKNYACPLGTIADDVRPFRLSEDACVSEAQAVK